MADTLQLQDNQKYGKEHLLLGNKTVVLRDCSGEEYEIHGLLANDLMMKKIDGTVVTLKDYILSNQAQLDSVENAIIITDSGTVTTVKELANAIEGLNFTELEAQGLYNQI
jgi:hypothetical protein